MSGLRKEEEEMKLYDANGKRVGLKEVAIWWSQTYPEKIFVGLTDTTKIIVEIRERMDMLLKKTGWKK